MAYGSLSDVKELAGISDSSEDSLINLLLDSVSEDVDNRLKDHTTVPLTSPPSIIDSIVTEWTYGKFRQLQGPDPEEGVRWVESSKERLELYLRETYKKASFEASGRMSDT